jgi:haloacid dehalogenase-like hydrolase
LDPGFPEFYDWTVEHNVPVIVLSSGMEPIIRALLAKLIGPKADGIPIISNNVDIGPDGTWKIVYRDESRKSPECPLSPDFLFGTDIFVCTDKGVKTLDTTSLAQFDRTLRYQQTTARSSSTAETAYQISVQPGKRIYFSRRKVEI